MRGEYFCFGAFGLIIIIYLLIYIQDFLFIYKFSDYNYIIYKVKAVEFGSYYIQFPSGFIIITDSMMQYKTCRIFSRALSTCNR